MNERSYTKYTHGLGVPRDGMVFGLLVQAVYMVSNAILSQFMLIYMASSMFRGKGAVANHAILYVKTRVNQHKIA